ncbi:MAG: hypothetical protein FWD58_03105 [Firmicutes bacterium]|nr:hypothetical protein [Bacillota bacterium]
MSYVKNTWLPSTPIKVDDLDRIEDALVELGKRTQHNITLKYIKEGYGEEEGTLSFSFIDSDASIVTAETIYARLVDAIGATGIIPCSGISRREESASYAGGPYIAFYTTVSIPNSSSYPGQLEFSGYNIWFGSFPATEIQVPNEYTLRIWMECIVQLSDKVVQIL